MLKRNYILQSKNTGAFLAQNPDGSIVETDNRYAALRFFKEDAEFMTQKLVFECNYKAIQLEAKWGIFNEESQLCYAKRMPDDMELFFFSCNPDCKQLLFDSEQEAKAVLATLEKIAIKAESHYFEDAFVKEVSINA